MQNFDVMRINVQEKVLGHLESVKILVILTPTGWLHVDNFQFCCIHSFEVYSSIISSKVIGNSPEVLDPTSTGYSSNSTGYVTNCRFSPSSDVYAQVHRGYKGHLQFGEA